MPQKSRATLKALFEDGDLPNASDYADLIDSAVNLVDTTAQSFRFPLQVSSLSTGIVCADRLYISTLNLTDVTALATLSAQSIITSALQHRGPYAHMYSVASLHQPNSTTPVKITGTGERTSAHASDLLGFTHTNPNRLTYLGAPCRALVHYHLSGEINDPTSYNIGVMVAKNGVVDRKTLSFATGVFSQQTQFTNASIMALTSGDYLELFAETTAAAVGVTGIELTMTVFPISWTF